MKQRCNCFLWLDDLKAFSCTKFDVDPIRNVTARAGSRGILCCVVTIRNEWL
jgi:hypothetical protein